MFFVTNEDLQPKKIKQNKNTRIFRAKINPNYIGKNRISIIKRFYSKSNTCLDFGGENPFDGGNIKYTVEEPGSNSLVQIIAQMPLAAINNTVLQTLIAGTGAGNSNLFAKVFVHSIPLAVGLFTQFYGLQSNNNAIGLATSLMTRYAARRLTGSAHFGALELIKDAYHVVKLYKTIDTNTRAVYKWGETQFAWAAGWANYFKSWIPGTKLASKNISREVGMDVSTNVTNVNDNIIQVVHEGKIYYFDNQIYDVIKLYKNELPQYKLDLLMGSLNHKDSLTETLAKKYLQTTTEKLQIAGQPNVPKINNEIATHHLDYAGFNHRVNITSKEDALLIAEKIKNTSVPKSITSQPDILLQPEVLNTSPFALKIFYGVLACLVIYLGYRTVTDNKEFFIASIGEVKIKLNRFLFGQQQIVEVPVPDQKPDGITFMDKFIKYDSTGQLQFESLEQKHLYYNWQSEITQKGAKLHNNYQESESSFDELDPNQAVEYKNNEDSWNNSPPNTNERKPEIKYNEYYQEARDPSAPILGVDEKTPLDIKGEDLYEIAQNAKNNNDVTTMNKIKDAINTEKPLVEDLDTINPVTKTKTILNKVKTWWNEWT